MAMEVHNALRRDMDCLVKECLLVFSMINDWEVIYLCLFVFNFARNVLVLLFNVL
jgi:hypothetical protein